MGVTEQDTSTGSARGAAPYNSVGGILASATVLALLYFGRGVLVPVTLAVILSLVIAPLVRALRRLGLGRVPAVVAAGSALAVLMLGLATAVGLQLVSVATSLPQYEQTIHSKVEALREVTVGRLTAMRGQAATTERAGAQRNVAPAEGVVPVELQDAQASPFKIIAQVFASAWEPLQTTGTVLVVLLFVLLEHEALRDRFIRLAGVEDLRATTAALNDAGERLSRYFASQFALNFGVGVVVGAGLAALGFPHATLWAVLTAVLRFVPYVGVVLAAVSAGLFAAAVDPGWALMAMTLGLYGIVEAVAAQLVEPQLYGHSTGLSPLSVVIAAVFWSWMWGPVGLIVATPLTLCLMVAGRHVKALEFLDILLGDAPALTMPQRFYQRALSGDSDEMIAAARVFLKRWPFAVYCDAVLMPALRLAHFDYAAGTISDEQRLKVRGAIARVIETLDSETGKRPRKPPRGSVLDDPSAGHYLRRQRERVSGRWQGPLAAPAGSVAIGVGLGSLGDELVTEILVRVLRDHHIDARHLTIEETRMDWPPGATPSSVAMAYIVSTDTDNQQETGSTMAADIRRKFPQACIVALLLPTGPEGLGDAPAGSHADLVASSFEEAAHYASERICPVAPGEA